MAIGRAQSVSTVRRLKLNWTATNSAARREADEALPSNRKWERKREIHKNVKLPAGPSNNSQRERAPLLTRHSLSLCLSVVGCGLWVVGRGWAVRVDWLLICGLCVCSAALCWAYRGAINDDVELGCAGLVVVCCYYCCCCCLSSFSCCKTNSHWVCFVFGLVFFVSKFWLTFWGSFHIFMLGRNNFL